MDVWMLLLIAVFFYSYRGLTGLAIRHNYRY